jgi:hypothetical protein
MDKNLAENDIPDETEELIELGIDVDDYIPAIHLYFNDDLTIAWEFDLIGTKPYLSQINFSFIIN